MDGVGLPVPELPVEPPLLPGSLSLFEVVELQAHGDEQLDEGDGAQQPVAVPDGGIVAAQPHHTQLHTETHKLSTETPDCVKLHLM